MEATTRNSLFKAIVCAVIVAAENSSLEYVVIIYSLLFLHAHTVIHQI